MCLRHHHQQFEFRDLRQTFQTNNHTVIPRLHRHLQNTIILPPQPIWKPQERRSRETTRWEAAQNIAPAVPAKEAHLHLHLCRKSQSQLRRKRLTGQTLQILMREGAYRTASLNASFVRVAAGFRHPCQSGPSTNTNRPGEKARENRERAERDSRNQEYAGNSYRVPESSDYGADSELSGLPWGSVSFAHFSTHGNEAGSRRSSARETYVGDDGYANNAYDASPPYTSTQWTQPASYGGSSGGDDTYYEDAYYYDPNQGQ